MGSEEELVHAIPQTKGKAVHEAVDEKKYSSRKDDIVGIAVFSEEFGLTGKIDIFHKKEKLLLERKYKLETIYQGQIYQLWAQYFCMTEMGYEIDKLAMHSISTNKSFSIGLPGIDGKKEFTEFIHRYKNFDPSAKIEINENKCTHCIYINLCDKTKLENVYS